MEETELCKIEIYIEYDFLLNYDLIQLIERYKKALKEELKIHKITARYFPISIVKMETKHSALIELALQVVEFLNKNPVILSQIIVAEGVAITWLMNKINRERVLASMRREEEAFKERKNIRDIKIS